MLVSYRNGKSLWGEGATPIKKKEGSGTNDICCLQTQGSRSIFTDQMKPNRHSGRQLCRKSQKKHPAWKLKAFGSGMVNGIGVREYWGSLRFLSCIEGCGCLRRGHKTTRVLTFLVCPSDHLPPALRIHRHLARIRHTASDAGEEEKMRKWLL